MTKQKMVNKKQKYKDDDVIIFIILWALGFFAVLLFAGLIEVILGLLFGLFLGIATMVFVTIYYRNEDLRI